MLHYSVDKLFEKTKQVANNIDFINFFLWHDSYL